MEVMKSISSTARLFAAGWGLKYNVTKDWPSPLA